MTSTSEVAPALPEGLGLEAGREQLGMGLRHLWIAYFGIGGNGTPEQVGRWMSGADDVPGRDHDFLAQVLNEAFGERGQDHPVRYRLGE
ncbi:MAG TPA: hypothetical protein VGB03_07435 [Acidimicrobiales bacterium]|jgi:uncharacterized protein (DUF2267 family)